MKKEEIQKIKDKIDVLIGMRMVEIERLGNTVGFGFISIDKDEAIIKNQLREIERIAPDYTIDAFGMFRWTYRDRVVLARQDMFEPSLAILKANGLDVREGAQVPDFDCDEYGNNRFDEINEQNFKPIYEQTKSFLVKKISISKFGDLTMDFENGYGLEIFIDASDPLNCWEFSEICKANNITIGANEIVEEDIDITQT